MKISTKGIYGLKAMVDLAKYSSEDVVTLKSISERENISERYLEQIFSLLRKSGLIKGRKGSQGGYVITEDISKITIAQILKSLEGELFVVPKMDKGNILDKCIKENVWDKLNESINNVVDQMTLEELLNQYDKYTEEPYMYYI